MKKKLISLLLVGVMLFSNAAMVSANDSHIYEEKTSEKVSGAVALADENGVIIDVRAAKRQENYWIEGSISLPLFTVDANNKNVAIDLTDGVSDELEDNFNNYLAEHGDTLAGKMIYILCNSGATGAKNATTLLYAAGYSLDNIRTIENGAKSLDILDAAITSGDYWENSYSNYVTAEDAVAAIGSETIVTFDVRATKRYDAGHLKGSISLPLFSVDENDKNVVTALDGELATAFTSYVTDNKADLSGKTIYILCNGGQSGARTALKLLLAAGYDFENIYTIKGGAGNTDLQPSLNFVSAAQALSVIGNDDYIILDVRATKRYDAGHLEGSVHQPLFTVDENDKNVVTTRDDELAQAFNEFVDANRAELESKTIYILCNGGASGAAAATYLLEQKGITDNVYTIEGGANGNPSIQEKFVVDTPQDTPSTDNTPSTGETPSTDNSASANTTTTTNTVKTGDSAPIMTYTLMMGVALLAVVAAGKKKFAK